MFLDDDEEFTGTEQVCVCVCVKLSVDRSMTVAESLTKNERGRAHDPVYAKRAQE